MGTATFNWSYKSGAVLPNGTTVPTTADDVKPTGIIYIANFGNDNTGNGSRQRPYKTIAKSITIGQTQVKILGSGVYREIIQSATLQIGILVVGDGNVIIDGSLVANSVASGAYDAGFYNLTFKNWQNISNYSNLYSGCKFINIGAIDTGTANDRYSKYKNCLFSYVGNGVDFWKINIAQAINSIQNCTFYKCSSIRFTESLISGGLYRLNSCIFYECNIHFLDNCETDFHTFFRCNVRFIASTVAVPTVFYPSIPTGYTKIDDIATLRSSKNSVYPTAQVNYQNTTIADPLFNNLAVDDYTLSLVSPAKNRSYFGTYVGAFSIAKGLKVKASATLSDFDNTTAINLTIADDSLTLISTSSNASIITKPIDNTTGRELLKFPVFGLNADRNGEYVDSTSDLDVSTVSAGTTLLASTPYLVETGSITYNSVVYQSGDRFTSLASSQGTFTTSTGGVLREILEAPARENLEARFTDGAAGYTSSGSIAVDSWYYVEIGSITYDGVAYAVGTFFKGTATTTFTGIGSPRLVFAAADAFLFFEINQKPTSNNVGNARTGAISQGNGNKDFDRTSANVFSINKKFIQIKYTIQVNNLTP